LGNPADPTPSKEQAQETGLENHNNIKIEVGQHIVCVVNLKMISKGNSDLHLCDPLKTGES
jgi:hypothetical protein